MERNVNGDPIIDPQVFTELKNTVGAEFIGELVDAYLDDTPRLLDELKQYLAQADAKSFSRTAHSIKSSSASLGALSFSALARELEMTGKQDVLSGCEEKVERLAAEYLAVQERLKELKNE